MSDNRDTPSRLNYPFVGIPSFLRSKICTDLEQLDGDIAVFGIPHDEGSPFLTGSRMGPRSIREHSLRFGAEGSIYDPETRTQYLSEELGQGLIVDVGDVDVWPTEVRTTFKNATDMTRQILAKGAFPVMLGGDHGVTYPVVRGFTMPLHVMHFDAHIDYAPFIHDLQFTNGHPFSNIKPLAHVESLTQIGIRSLRSAQSQVHASIDDGNRVITMGEFYDIGGQGVAEILPRDAPCYISVDIDVLDISLVPGCVSAEPNGMTYAELRNTLAALTKHANVVGFDLVEVNPHLDVGTGTTSYLAAHTVVEFLGLLCSQPRWVERRAERARQRVTHN